VRAIDGIGRIAAGDDLAAILLAALGDDAVEDGDIVVVTSKVVSKAEGRSAPASERERLIDDESTALVAARGPLRIVRTATGLVLAAAGIDASNTDADTVLLLPRDPDASAQRLRRAIHRATGRAVAVVITDTAGRPWREGQVDLAIGVSGLIPLDDHRGLPDTEGRAMDATVIAVADEVAAAADLVKGKTAGRPFAVVRGMGRFVIPGDGDGARALVRPSDEDLFPLGSAEARRAGARAAVHARRTIRSWRQEPVPLADIEAIVAAAITAPAPHGTTPWRFVLLADDDRRTLLLDAMAEQWRADLAADGADDDAIARRVRRGDLLRQAPALLIPALVDEGRHPYPDERRRGAEDVMFWLSGGAAVQNALVQAAALGYGAAWVSSTLFCAPVVRRILDWPETWQPLGAIALGRAAQPATERPARDVSSFLRLQ
jgi:coenzyme F420-0:L-glutamate ligase/coenzyme F420-1:gamma-L-glutamate ligase